MKDTMDRPQEETIVQLTNEVIVLKDRLDLAIARLNSLRGYMGEDNYVSVMSIIDKKNYLDEDRRT
jgi:GTP cyclohydrolase III